MALPYNRKFNKGRQSELFYNEDLSKNYEAIRHLLDTPTEQEGTPVAKVDGALWLNLKENALKRYHKNTGVWENLFSAKFQITDQITNINPSSNPVLGQLWINNDILMYFDGSTWKPIRSLVQDGSQFDMSAFENHKLISPLNSIGNSVIKDYNANDFETQLEEDKQNKVDVPTGSEFDGDGHKWDVGKVNNGMDNGICHTCQDGVCSIDGNVPETFASHIFKSTDEDYTKLSQFLVPNINIDRVFLDRKLDFTYQTVSNVCIQYPKSKVYEQRPSLIHVNSNRLRNIKKRLVKIDRDVQNSTKIKFNEQNFELYGFKGDSPLGELLLPEKILGDGGYTKTRDGVFLNHGYSQNFDYVLIVSFEFGSFKTTGQLNHVWNGKKETSYYVPNFAAPHNVFINGYNLEDNTYTEDDQTKIITIQDSTQGMELTGFHSIIREFGYVYDVDINQRGHVNLSREYYKDPLLFVGGEVITAQDGLVFEDNKRYTIPDCPRNTVWAVAELQGEETDPIFTMRVKNGTGHVPSDNTILFDNVDVKPTDRIIAFIDGILVKEEDMVRNQNAGTLTIEGIHEGQTYTLLKDRYNRFFSDANALPAMITGKFNETLVYLNGYLLNNETSIYQHGKPEDVKGDTNEIKFFITDVVNGNVVGDYYIWITSENEHGEDTSKWVKCDPTDTYYKQVVKELECFCHSYQNARTSVLLNNDKLAEYNIQFDEFSDRLDIYAFKYTAFAGQPLIIKNIYLDGGQNKFTTDNRRFKIPDKFEPNYGLLSVYIDGIRQYYVNENQDGLGFSLPSPVKAPAMVTYVIETVDAPSESYCKRIILDEKNIVPNTINVYKTYRTDVPDTNPDDRISLYPGRVSVYIDGVRQPQNSFTIVDNYTISFNSSLTKIVGGKDTFPYEVIRNELGEAMYHVDGSLRVMEHSETDKILIEVKQDLDKVESYIEVPPTNDGFSIDIAANQLDPAILETNDEILMYLDGLFLGLRDNDSSTFTYTKDVYRGKITINSPYHIEEIISDPLNDYLNANPQAAEAYKKNNGGKPYAPKPKKIILEWRNE